MKAKGIALALAAMVGMTGSAQAMPQVGRAAPVVAAPMSAAAAYGDPGDRRSDRGEIRGNPGRNDRGWNRGERRGWERGRHYGRKHCWNVRRWGRWQRVCRWR